jgi:ribosomal protein L37AE/L43A
MARNPVQFQPGLSLTEFFDRYGTEAQCHEALFAIRWPSGFVCPECANTTYCTLARGVYQCHRCHHQTSLTAGTIFHATKLALRTWSLAIYRLAQCKQGLQRFSYRVSWM